MSIAVFQAMLLSLIRDRGALAMSFLLPGIVFVIFAGVFSGASSGTLSLRVAAIDARESSVSQRTLKALFRTEGISRVALARQDLASVQTSVQDGHADVGLVIRADSRALSDLNGAGPAPFFIVSDPTRAIAVQKLTGLLQNIYFTELPDVALRGFARMFDEKLVTFSPTQLAQIDEGLKRIGDSDELIASSRVSLDAMFESRAVVVRKTGASANVQYYAAAVAIMFLLFSSVSSAIELLRYKENGLLERLAGGPGGMRAVLQGSFGFLVAQGILQVTVIFLIAWLGFGVDVPAHFFSWSVTTCLASAAAAGLALGFVMLCQSYKQAQTLSSIVILILSALGGSMVPRYLMPPQVQDLGWFTPNTWVIEAYGATFWRGQQLAEIYPHWLALVAIGALGLLTATAVTRKHG